MTYSVVKFPLLSRYLAILVFLSLKKKIREKKGKFSNGISLSLYVYGILSHCFILSLLCIHKIYFLELALLFFF